MSDTWALTDLTGSYDLSANGKLEIGSCTLGGFKSGSISFTGDSVDNTTRDDQGWSKPAPGRRSATIEVTFNKLASDACQVGLRAMPVDTQTNWSSKGVTIKYTSKSADGTTTSGFTGTFILTDYSESQDATDGGGSAVECSATFQAWGAVNAVSA